MPSLRTAHLCPPPTLMAVASAALAAVASVRPVTVTGVLLSPPQHWTAPPLSRAQVLLMAVAPFKPTTVAGVLLMMLEPLSRHVRSVVVPLPS
ncbi:MAG: hypothetical protein FWC42_10575 [Proteobacteria bacterium]|nr:hypothetical protein [Pseudomonadota bacterium]